MEYAIMDMLPVDAAGHQVEWTTVSVESTHEAALAIAKPGQIVVPYDVHRWHNAEVIHNARMTEGLK